MKNIILILAIILLNFTKNIAQFHNNGAQIVIQNGVTVKIDMDFINEAGSNFQNNSKVIITKNITNNQVMPPTSTGLWELSGTAKQSIFGNSPLFVNDIKFDNGAGFELNNSIKIFGQANFSNGLVNNTNSFPLIFGPNATIPISPTDNSHVVGPVVKEGIAPFVYPLGDVNKYQPIATEFTNNSNGLMAKYIAADAGIGSFGTGGTDPLALSSYNTGEYWDMAPHNGGTASAFITMYWNGYNDSSPNAMTSRRVAHKVGTSWLNEGSTNTGGDINAGLVRSNLINTWSPFTLGFVTTTPLPLRLLSFSAKNTENGNQLNWLTSNEIGVSHFEIEKSENGKLFDKIGEINANGGPTENVSYEYIDRVISNNSLIYYRLKMIDLDGKYSYSKVVYLKNEKNKNLTLKLYPNPAISELTIENLKGEKVEVSNLNGMMTVFKAQKKSEVQSTIDISELPNGLYFLKAGNEVKKFLKQ